MAISNRFIRQATLDIWTEWCFGEIRLTVPNFGFREYLLKVYGFTYSGTVVSNFNYKIEDEQKFMMFVLKHVKG